jgi:hypothetical protein
MIVGASHDATMTHLKCKCGWGMGVPRLYGTALDLGGYLECWECGGCKMPFWDWDGGPELDLALVFMDEKFFMDEFVDKIVLARSAQ